MKSKGFRLCLAGSGGGHVRQLLDLERVWSRYDYFFVTEESALGESIAKNHPTQFVDHYTLGMLRLGHPLKMAHAMVRNFFQTLAIIRRERPEVVITTGAGAMFWTVLIGRLSGAKVILIDSFARFEAPSKFARMVKPFATDVVAQSDKIRRIWPDVLVFDPFKSLDEPPPPKKPLLLATVGATLPFDRLSEAVVNLVEKGAIGGEVVLQTGNGSRISTATKGLRVVATLGFDEMKAILRDAELVITHGGSGSLITALREGCRVVAMPRQFAKGEIYDNHQREITTAFEERGLIEVALETDDLGPAIERAQRKAPVMATTDPSALISWLETRLAEHAKA